MKNPNPQGKGTDLLVNHWYPKFGPKRKNLSEIITDYYCSLLVLSARMPFKPVIGQDYYLYIWHEELRISLIEPEKLAGKTHIDFICGCHLQPDLTWALNVNPDVELTEGAKQYLATFTDGITEHLNSDKLLVELFPTYAAHLPYYARLFASGLSKSLTQSLPKNMRHTLVAKELSLHIQHIPLLALQNES